MAIYRGTNTFVGCNHVEEPMGGSDEILLVLHPTHDGEQTCIDMFRNKGNPAWTLLRQSSA
jgi:hypothetical protein